MFVTDSYQPPTLQVLDLSDLAEPQVVASYEPLAAPTDLAVAGPLVFLVVPDRVLILRLS